MGVTPPPYSSRTRTLVYGLLAVVALGSFPAAAHHPQGTDFKSGPDHEYGEMVKYPLVFPLEGNPGFGDNFNAWRSGNTTHHAIDIMVPRWTPVYAAASGTVIRINGTGNPANLPNQDKCCTLVLRHDDGWRTWYWHLNNDSAHLPAGQCDGKGWGIADGITIGSRVEAGQLIGWAGSSGNATCAYPHLHFELHDPHGVLVNPYWSLKNPVLPAYCTGPESGCTRLAGPNRFATATEVSKAHHDLVTGGRVYVASGDNFPDALSGAAVAARGGHPILLVRRGEIPATVKTELERLVPSEIVILGGSATVADSVATALGGTEYGSPEVTRLAGATRYSTAVAISAHSYADGEPTVVVIASGENFADALPAGTLAAKLDAPVLLTRGNGLPPEVKAEIQRLDPDTIFVMGGQNTISNAVMAELAPLAMVHRISGDSRYTTAIAASQEAFPDPLEVDKVYITVGTNYPDGLTGGAAAGMVGSPLLLVRPMMLDDAVRDEILRLGPKEIIILGGPFSVGSNVELLLKALVLPIVDDEEEDDGGGDEGGGEGDGGDA
jgi:putative cell wall-binding protein